MGSRPEGFRTGSVMLACALAATVAVADEVGITVPGTATYPDLGTQRLGLVQPPGEDNLNETVIDTDSGHAWVATETVPGRVVKLKLPSTPGDPPARLGALYLLQGEGIVTAAAADLDERTAILVTAQVPANVIRVHLGEGDDLPTRTGSLALPASDASVTVAVMDTAKNCAYLGSSVGLVIKIDMGTADTQPTRVGSVQAFSSHQIRAGAIDMMHGYAYFGSYMVGSTARVAKIVAGPREAQPTLASATLLLNSGESAIYGVALDPAAGIGLFTTETTPGRVVKVALGAGDAAPTRVGAVTLAAGENNAQATLIDAASGYAWIGTRTDPGRVAKLSVGAPNAAPQRIGGLVLEPGESGLESGGIDAEAGILYMSCGSFPARFVTIDGGDGADPPQRLNGIALDGDIGPAACMAGDPSTGLAVVCTSDEPSIVTKSFAGFAGDQARYVGSTTLELVDGAPSCAILDASNEYVYLGTDEAAVVKVAINESEGVPSRIGSATTGNDGISCGARDSASGYLFFGARNASSQAVVLKASAGMDDALPSVVSQYNSSSSGTVRFVAPDGAGHIYVGFELTGSLIVARLVAGTGDAAPVHDRGRNLGFVGTAAAGPLVDPASGYLWFTATSSNRLRKMLLGLPGETPTVAASVSYTGGGSFGPGPASNLSTHLAWYPIAATPSRLAKVSLGPGAAAPSIVGTVPLTSGENALREAMMSPDGTMLCVCTANRPAGLALFSLSNAPFLRATRVVLPAGWSAPETMRFFSHSGDGTARLAIYDDGDPMQLLWESPALADRATDASIDVSIASGAPSSLVLSAGVYWLAWQADTDSAVGSHNLVPLGSGMIVRNGLPGFPDQIARAAASFVDDGWTQSLTYAATVPVVLDSFNVD